MSIPVNLVSKHLFIEHVAEHMAQLEQAMSPRKALNFLVHARMLRDALAGYPESLLSKSLAQRFPCVAEALQNRSFDSHGFFPEARHVKRVADEWVARWVLGSDRWK